MDNDIDAVADRLIKSIGAQDGELSVLPWRLDDDEPFRLRVFVSPMFRHISAKVPSEFEGYTVSVEPMPKMTGH